MGCASSTPMIQTTGSEMLKAATHVASDATKSAEDAVEGVKDSVGKTLETAKDSVASTVESVKHEVEHVVKEKTEMLEDAKNSLMEKLHLKPADETETNDKNAEHEEEPTSEKTETDELKTQLNEHLNHSQGIEAINSLETTAAKDLKEHVLTRTDTETDSLKTSTPEPEIEQALAKSHDSTGEEDEDNPPTPKPTLAELENLTAEVLKQNEAEAKTLVNDLKKDIDPLMVKKHDNSSNDDNHVTEDHETMAEVASTVLNELKSNNMHKTPQIPTAVQTKPPQNQKHTRETPPLLPLTLATTNIATLTTTAGNPLKSSKEKNNTKMPSQVIVKQAHLPPVANHKPQPTPPSPPPEKVKKSKLFKREEKAKIVSDTSEKRPGTTEWEKFADMLAQARKFNPHDAIRRGGIHSKFGGGGFFREKPSFVGHHMANGMEYDSSDTNLSSQRSSARAGGRVQRLPNRPNTGNQRKNNHELSTHHNGGGKIGTLKRRNSNLSSTSGRKFDYNPSRSRVTHEFAASVSSSSSPFNIAPLQITTQMPFAPYGFSSASDSHTYESVKSPDNMRSHHSRSHERNLPPLDSLTHNQAETMAQSQQQQTPSYMGHDINTSLAFDHQHQPVITRMPLQSDPFSHDSQTLTRQSSNTSLYSNTSYADNSQVIYKSSSTRDVSRLSINPPVKNTSSFLSTPRQSPFSVRKSYTDLFFSSTSNKENKPQAGKSSRDKSSNKTHRRCDVCCKKIK